METIPENGFGKFAFCVRSALQSAICASLAFALFVSPYGIFGKNAAWGQAMYKTITPDGQVIYSDKPPAAGQGNVQQLQPPQNGGAAIAPTPMGPRPTGVMPVMPALRMAPPELLRGTKEMSDANECRRTHQNDQSLMRAAEEVIRSVNNARAVGARGASAYQSDLLERQWKYYKSIGGTAASPEQVQMPEDPCKEAGLALERKSSAVMNQYQECVAAHPKEIKLSALSRELIGNCGFLAALEKYHEEKRTNPGFDASAKGGGEWAAAFKADPAVVRTAVAMKFQEYRDAGGPAARLEDVTEIPNPCLPEKASLSQPSPINAKRSLTVPPPVK